jgi:hypothetical protein
MKFVFCHFFLSCFLLGEEREEGWVELVHLSCGGLSDCCGVVCLYVWSV